MGSKGSSGFTFGVGRAWGSLEARLVGSGGGGLSGSEG